MASSGRRKGQPTPVFLPGESRGRGTWWAAVHGVTQSRTRLKRLSMHACMASSCHITFILLLKCIQTARPYVPYTVLKSKISLQSKCITSFNKYLLFMMCSVSQGFSVVQEIEKFLPSPDLYWGWGMRNGRISKQTGNFR